MKLLLLFFCGAVHAAHHNSIDVVIPCTPQDAAVVSTSIAHLKKHGKNIRRIIIVSTQSLAPVVEWFDEKNYPFSRQDIAKKLYPDGKGIDHNVVYRFFQKLVKLYAPLVIPNISEHVLIFDPHVILLQDTFFIDEYGYVLHDGACKGSRLQTEYGQRVVLGYKRVAPYAMISNKFMLMHKSAVQELFESIRSYHECEPWIALCNCLNESGFQGSMPFSEYELYGNFALNKSYPGLVRPLPFKTIRNISLLDTRSNNQQEYAYAIVTGE